LYFVNTQNQSSSSGVEFLHIRQRDESLGIYRKHGGRVEVLKSGDLKIKGKNKKT